ncbi:MAG: hypothetical protein ACK4K7_09185 [Allosphingosinicella sp.]|uniref:hypothetical protein n=1 Tax=Allosphingosinicella sp. TaxID=2823234 RepID=UPI00395BAC29
MTHQAAPDPTPGRNEAGRQVAQLRELLGLVEAVAGRGAPEHADGALDEAALISAAYETASPLVRRRFDALAAETAAWAAAGVEALVAAEAAGPRGAAARLADELEGALYDLSRTVGASPTAR